MLEHTFIHLPNFGPARERKLWSAGILTWDDYLDQFASSPYHGQQCSIIASSKYALKNLDGSHFARTMPSNEMWRCFPHYRKIAYLDIETTGCTSNDYITVIGVYDGKKTHSYVKGKNLGQFARDIKKFDMVATFNGSLFDLPFIRREMDAELPALHIDLRFLLASLNMTGGLKRIEQKFGLEREDDLQGLTGYDAVLMWRRYRKYHDRGELDRLVRYNAADVCNLETLLNWAYKEKRKGTGIDQFAVS